VKKRRRLREHFKEITFIAWEFRYRNSTNCQGFIHSRANLLRIKSIDQVEGDISDDKGKIVQIERNTPEPYRALYSTD